MDFDTLLLKLVEEFSENKGINVEDYCKQFPQHREQLLNKLRTAKFIKNNLCEEDLSNKEFGEYHILQELGRGGMGIVFLAVQPSLSRLVTIKVLPPGFALDQAALKNFQKEAKIIAKFNHPNIIPVFSFANEKGVNYIVMGYVPGPSLKELVDKLRPIPKLENVKASTIKDIVWAFSGEKQDASRQSITLKRSSLFWEQSYYEFAAAIGTEISEAISYAHQNGIFHGDLKPSNILLTPDFIPMVVDFGLAQDIKKLSEDKPTEFSGTLLYAAPEQIKDNIVNAKTDIWSLGATLYELLTLNIPFRGSSFEKTVEKIMKTAPLPLRYYNRKIPVELEIIVLKCMENRPEKRYNSAAELACDLRHYLQSKPIKAKPAGLSLRAYKWMKRNPGTAIWILAAVLLGAASSFLLFNKKIQDIVKDGTSALDNAQYSAAVNNYTQAMSLIKYTPFFNKDRRKEILKDLGRAWRGKGNFQEAIRCLKESVRIDPNYVPGIEYLADTYLEKGEYDKAIGWYKVVLSMAPDDRYSMYYLGDALTHKGLLDEAIEMYHKAITIAPEDIKHSKIIVSLLHKINLTNNDEIRDYLTNKGFTPWQVESILQLFHQAAPK